jgi:hypothetical protein
MGKVIKRDGILVLPFVVEVPDPQRKRRVIRKFWSEPPGSTEYGEACEIGRQWAAAYVSYCQSPASGGGLLPWIVHDMGEWQRGLSDGSRWSGFMVGFLSAIDTLARCGADAWGGAQKFVDAQNEHYRKAQQARDTEAKEQTRTAVARMNAGRAAKKALGRAAAKESANG